MFLRCCLPAVLLAAVPAFSATFAAVSAVGDTAGALVRAAAPVFGAIGDIHAIGFAIGDTHGSPGRAAIWEAAIWDTHHALRGAIGDTHRMQRRAAGQPAGGAIEDTQGMSRRVEAIGDTHNPSGRAAALAVATIGETQGAFRNWTCRGTSSTGGDHAARSAEISQSVIRNAAVVPGLRTGIFGIGEARAPDTQLGSSLAPA